MDGGGDEQSRSTRCDGASEEQPVDKAKHLKDQVEYGAPSVRCLLRGAVDSVETARL